MFNLQQCYWDWKFKIKRQIGERKIFLKKYGRYTKRAVTLMTINKEVSKKCTQLFVDGIESGIYSVEQDSYRCNATFNNGWKVSFWKENKMYAYAQDATFTSPEGIKYRFNGFMPDKWCLFYILEKIENHTIS